MNRRRNITKKFDGLLIMSGNSLTVPIPASEAERQTPPDISPRAWRLDLDRLLPAKRKPAR